MGKWKGVFDKEGLEKHEKVKLSSVGSESNDINTRYHRKRKIGTKECRNNLFT